MLLEENVGNLDFFSDEKCTALQILKLDVSKSNNHWITYNHFKVDIISYLLNMSSKIR